MFFFLSQTIIIYTYVCVCVCICVYIYFFLNKSFKLKYNYFKCLFWMHMWTYWSVALIWTQVQIRVMFPNTVIFLAPHLFLSSNLSIKAAKRPNERHWQSFVNRHLIWMYSSQGYSWPIWLHFCFSFAPFSLFYPHTGWCRFFCCLVPSR